MSNALALEYSCQHLLYLVGKDRRGGFVFMSCRVRYMLVRVRRLGNRNDQYDSSDVPLVVRVEL